MVERHWYEGQMVALPKVTPYIIVQLVGEAGNIHIDQRGRYHPYWHKERPDGQIVLIHHGGSGGFDTLKAVSSTHFMKTLFFN